MNTNIQIPEANIAGLITILILLLIWGIKFKIGDSRDKWDKCKK